MAVKLKTGLSKGLDDYAKEYNVDKDMWPEGKRQVMDKEYKNQKPDEVHKQIKHYDKYEPKYIKAGKLEESPERIQARKMVESLGRKYIKRLDEADETQSIIGDFQFNNQDFKFKEHPWNKAPKMDVK